MKGGHGLRLAGLDATEVTVRSRELTALTASRAASSFARS